ncbi:MAG: glycosyltransferase [Bacteroidetes bacterium]|jgi:glycosyltransferase involved in cell wall biosynthesis|nr:glycosyltransferase [Bacteroidota bacterium]
MTINKKKTIIFILPDLESGGAERIVTTIANHLSREKFVPKILLLRKEGAYITLLKDDVEIIDLKVKRIRQSIFPILGVIKKYKPSIVFSGFGEVNAYLAPFIPLFRKTKFIARETNVVTEHVTRPEIKFFYKFYNNYHKIICQSDDMKKDLLEKWNIKPKKIIKINNPVDFQAIDKHLGNQEKPESYGSEYKNVVAVGNLAVRKGFDNLLKVFSYLKDEKILLHILGDGVEKENLLQMKENLGLSQIIFHGKKENPYPYLKFADLFVLSSRYEGFPNVLLEAGACGTFALANDCPGGIREIVQKGINGEIEKIENHEVFAKNIIEILNKKHYSQEIRNAIESRFSKEIIMEKYEEVLDEL